MQMKAGEKSRAATQLGETRGGNDRVSAIAGKTKIDSRFSTFRPFLSSFGQKFKCREFRESRIDTLNEKRGPL